MKNSETYIVTAKTVDEAMAIAQREYGGSGKDISFDILEMPKKGFLGIGAKDAKIKVTVTEEEEINLGSIVAEMKSYRFQTDRDGADEPKKQPKPQQNAPKTEKADKPAQKQGGEPKQPKPQQNAPKADKPQQSAPKADKPAAEKPQQNAPKADRPQQNAPKADKPQAPKADKPQNAPKPERKPDAPKPAAEKPQQNAHKAEKPAVKTEKPVEKPVEKPAEKPQQSAPKAEKPAFAAQTGEKPVKKEAQASGILDNMPEYKITESGKKTPVYKETGANVKTYNRSPMQTAAVADGSILPEGTPVADVRWDSARDLKKAEEAAAAAMAAASRAAAPVAADAPIVEKIAPKAPAHVVDEPAEEDVYVPSDGSIDVAALDAAIEAMVEELPAPESRKKTGITAAEMEYALAFVTTLLANMQIDAKAVALPCPEGEEYEIEGDANVYPAMEIAGEGTGILIGHHGETLDAIQYLLNLAAIRHSDNQNGDYVKISLDIENYRAKREETLRSLARRMAARALKYKRNVFLEPMNAYERRIIHSELQNVENVSTHSVGTDKNRKIIITYEGPDKVFDDRRRADRPENGENRRRDHGRNRKKNHDNAAPAAESTQTEEVVENTAAEGAEKPQGEHKSRNRNRNRNRNRRRHSEGENAGSAEVQEAPQSAGAAAIISGAEKEALERQLTDPTLGGKKPQQEISLEDLPSYQQKNNAAEEQ